MGRELGPKCRVCRRLGIKLFLKGTRCESVKCAMEKREKPPGQHGDKRPRFTDYGIHLREVQRVKKMYGLLDHQFKRFFYEANREPGNTGDHLIIMLERRLDNVLFRLNFAQSRYHARQAITHGHVMVNGRHVYSPSFLTKAGDIIKPSVRPRSSKMLGEMVKRPNLPNTPSWLKLQEDPPQGTLLRLPTMEEVKVPLNRQLIVEFMSR